MHVFYLHGFASSTRSSKATFLGGRLAQHGLTLHTPDFNEPDFSTLTISRMIRQTSDAVDALPPGPVILIGSSLGGFVAVQVALARPAQVARLVLLAPALDFNGSRLRTLGDRGLDEWQATDRLDVFHYGLGRTMSVGYGLYADACSYDCVDATLSMPIQIFQGRRDDSVDPVGVERWAASRPNVELHLLDDDHQLAASVEYIWTAMKRFLGLGGERR